MARTTASHRSTTTGRAQELQAKRATDRKKVATKTDAAKTTLRTKREPASTVDQKPVRKATTAARTPAKAATSSKTVANKTATNKTVTKRKRIRQRPMEVQDLVPGPLPADTQAPQQTALPRKIRL